MENLSDSREIDGCTVTTTAYDPFAANRMLCRFGALFAPLAGLISGVQKTRTKSGKLAFGNVDLDGTGAALFGVLSQVQGAQADQFLAEILASTVVVREGAKIDLSKREGITRAFHGRLTTMYKVAAFALETNYRDFFDFASGKIAEVLGAMQATESPEASPDGSSTRSGSGTSSTAGGSPSTE